jgi:hypothetical protein
MSIDLVNTTAKVIPAQQEITYPLLFMRKCLINGSQNGLSIYTEHIPYRRILAEDGVTVIGGETKPEADGDIIVITKDVPLDAVSPNADSESLIASTIGQYVANGGNIMSLAFASMLLCVQQEGIIQGKISGQ